MSNQQPPNGGDEIPPPKPDFSAPPPYELTACPPANQQLPPSGNGIMSHMHVNLQPQHTKLPTYEEVEMEKSLNGELPPSFTQMQMLPPPPPLHPPPGHPLTINSSRTGLSDQPTLTFIAIDTSNADADNHHHSALANDNSLLGTDVMFAAAFLVAFLFNWIGFLILTCFCHTIAARYGALSGFGLSLAKWTFIVKHSTDLASHENSWLWWLIMAFGFLICVRALVQYVSIKRTWRLLSASAQERLLFFY